jgi:hypothetical protein
MEEDGRRKEEGGERRRKEEEGGRRGKGMANTKHFPERKPGPWGINKKARGMEGRSTFLAFHEDCGPRSRRGVVAARGGARACLL